MKFRNHTALNPLLKKSHVHTEKVENIEKIINNQIQEYFNTLEFPDISDHTEDLTNPLNFEDYQ